MLEEVCADNEGYDCHWMSDPYTPPRRPVRAAKDYNPACGHGGWTYELFDSRGHCAVFSQTFSSKALCIKAAQEDVDAHNTYDGYGKNCRAVVWPPSVVGRGTLVKGKKPGRKK